MENRFLRLIEVLTRHQVRFVVVGGVAAVLQRVPVATQDFDLVHDRAEDNVQRLLGSAPSTGATRVSFVRTKLTCEARATSCFKRET